MTPATLSSIAVTEAIDNGEANPTQIEYSQGTRGDANEVASGDIIPAPQGDTPSYLIVAHGNFVVQNFQGPPGASPPTGTVMTLVVDAASGQVTDFGVADVAPNLAQLGPVRTLPTQAVISAERSQRR